MCGFLAASWLIANLTDVNFFLQARGPTATNVWQGYGFNFVHNLLHMTGERVLQPFHDPHARVVVLFNGEIYNWRDLQGGSGHFRSDGDALIPTYLRAGVGFARHLDGEFALALFDFARGRAVLATDPFGTKPLWLARGAGGRLAVSSYPSALLRLGLQRRGIRAVEPNSIVVLEIGGLVKRGGGLAAEGPSGSPTDGPPPPVLAHLTTFEFDLRQHKNSTRDWRSAFVAAVEKRARGVNSVSLCFSDGYDTGAISLALGRLCVPHALYTVQAREDVRVLAARLRHAEQCSMDATLNLVRLSAGDFACERAFLAGRAERIQYTLRAGYANIDDKAAAGLSWIFRQAARHGRRLFLSGSGADEVISDYGMHGQALEFHSTLRGHFPDDLAEAFPWLNFFLGTQRDYLAKEEMTAGAHGVETRYPFLDRAVVQEYLWLGAGLKNSAYKVPIHDLLAEAGYPFIPGRKRGFSADRNLGGANDDAESRDKRGRTGADAGSAAAREGLWTGAQTREQNHGCADHGTAVLQVNALPSTVSRAWRDVTEPFEVCSAPMWLDGRPAPCLLHVPLQELLRAVPPLPAADVAGRAGLIQMHHCGQRCAEQGRTRTASRNRLGLFRQRCGNRFGRCISARTAHLVRAASAGAKEWAANLAGLRSIRGAAAADALGDVAPPLSIAAANGYRPQHKVVFVSSCMEEHYFWTYCAPLLSSFADAFEDDTGLVRDAWMHIHKIIIGTAGVALESLAKVESLFPFVEFVAFRDGEELDQHETSAEADMYRRTAYQSLKLTQYVRIWQEHVLGLEADFVVCMDSDMLVVRPFGHVFELLAQRRVDVAFTYYDGKRAVPWGTAEELARTKGQGYVRLQGGMLLMRNGAEALHWFALWTSLTATMLHDVNNDGHQKERWTGLYHEFKGPSQAALAFLLTRGQMELMTRIEDCCSVVRKVMLEPIQKGGHEVPVRMLGIPARYLNDAESTDDGNLPPSVHIVHLKGSWWRSVLPYGDEDLVVHTRSYEWNQEAFELWRKNFIAIFGNQVDHIVQGVTMRALALAACAHTAAAREYVHSESYMGEDFFSKWVFWNAPDASKGAVEYLDHASALANGIVNATPSRVYLGSDGKAYDGGRRAVRIQSAETYNAGLFVVKVDHVPTGCGTWPAFWLFGEDAEHVWPQWGEYDIIEGVHVMSRVMTTLHTTSHCDQSSVQKGQDFSSEWLPGAESGDADSCNVNARDQWFNQGCSQSGPHASLGPEFNAWGGGTFAAEWDPSGMHIRTWFWPVGNEPVDVAARTPDPHSWGMPYSYFTLRPDVCPASHFANMRLVFSLTFCGDLGDPTFADICPEYAQEMTCRELVTGHPDAFREAFWSIRSLDVYQKDQDSASPLPASAVTPATGTTSSGAQKYWLAAAGGFAAAAALMATTAAVLFRKTGRTGAQAGMLWEESHI